MGFDQSGVLRSKLDQKLANKQRKKDDQFAPPVDFSVKELSAEELRQELDRKYLEENFPDLESSYEKRVRFGK